MRKGLVHREKAKLMARATAMWVERENGNCGKKRNENAKNQLPTKPKD